VDIVIWFQILNKTFVDKFEVILSMFVQINL